MDASWEHYLDFIRKFRGDAGERTRETEERLSSLNSIKQHLNAINILMTEQQGQDCQEIMAVKVACDKILFSDYVCVANSALAASMVFSKIEEEELNIPEQMKPKVREIKGYFAKIKARSEKTDSLVNKIVKKVSRILRFAK